MKKPLNRTGKVGVGSQRNVEGSDGICVLLSCFGVFGEGCLAMISHNQRQT